MIPILLDPWLLTFSSDVPCDQLNVRTTSLRDVFSVLRAQYPLEILPFISEEEYTEFLGKLRNYKGADAMAVTRWISELVVPDEPEVFPAAISDAPCPDLSPLWLQVLAASGDTDDPPRWRFPMVLMPAIRKRDWPDDDEFNFTHEGSVRIRNLVCIDYLRSHKFFEGDIDPWRLRCIGDPKPAGPLATKAATCKRLPRPPQIHSNLPLGQLVGELKHIRDWSCGTGDRLFYIPPGTWNPISEGRTKWRNGGMFPRGIVQKKYGQTESGYADINGYVWVWDLGEKNHWDVKTTEDRRIARVTYDGKKLSS